MAWKRTATISLMTEMMKKMMRMVTEQYQIATFIHLGQMGKHVTARKLMISSPVMK